MIGVEQRERRCRFFSLLLIQAIMENKNESLRELIYNAKVLREDAITLLHVMREALSCAENNRVGVENLLYRESIDFVVCFTGLIEDLERVAVEEKI